MADKKVVEALDYNRISHEIVKGMNDRFVKRNLPYQIGVTFLAVDYCRYKIYDRSGSNPNVIYDVKGDNHKLNGEVRDEFNRLLSANPDHLNGSGFVTLINESMPRFKGRGELFEIYIRQFKESSPEAAAVEYLKVLVGEVESKISNIERIIGMKDNKGGTHRASLVIKAQNKLRGMLEHVVNDNKFAIDRATFAIEQQSNPKTRFADKVFFEANASGVLIKYARQAQDRDKTSLEMCTHPATFFIYNPDKMTVFKVARWEMKEEMEKYNAAYL